MSWNNYKEIVWSSKIETELERLAVFAADCNTSYQGKIENKGDTVRILGVGRPTVSEFSNDDDILLEDAEKVADTSVSIVADHVYTVHYGVGDIDKAQGAGNVLATLNQESSEAFANKIDKLVADVTLKDKQVVKTTAQTVTVDNCLSILDGALQALYENDVTPTTEITITLPPWFYTIFRQAYTKLDTDNSEILKNGGVARYSGAIIKMSNNCAVDNNGNTHVQVKTKRAIGLVKGNVHTEPYRPDKKFEDCIKGFLIAGVKVIRPKEMVVLVVKK